MGFKRVFPIVVIPLTLFFSCEEKFNQKSFREFLKSHSYIVGQKQVMLRDSLRKRPLKTEIWYPTKDSTGYNISGDYPFKLPPTSQNAPLINDKFPLVLLSHGTGGNRISQMWLACELAGEGLSLL